MIGDGALFGVPRLRGGSYSQLPPEGGTPNQYRALPPHSKLQFRATMKTMLRKIFIASLFIFTTLAPFLCHGQTWSAKLDDKINFYQATDVGAVVVGTKKSIYAVDGMTGDILWRRKDSSLDENDVAPIPGTDLLLVNFEKEARTRIEAIDALSGERLWQSEKLRGAVMHMAVDTETNLLAVVLARDAKGSAHDTLKRKPVVHVLDLKSGDELWKHEIGSDIEMMPTRWEEKDDVEYSLDNYEPPLLLDGRLYVFYEGVTSFDARTGKEKTREKFKVNEEGLALTEAAPVVDEAFIYTSGRGHVRAISRATGKVEWEAKDLGVTPELVVMGRVLFARTGGQFTRLKDGETIERGPYGVAAMDSRTGKVLWHYKGADKGITNLVIANASTLAVADRDELISIDPTSGKRLTHFSHHVKSASFALVNDRGEVVIGGREEIAAFRFGDGSLEGALSSAGARPFANDWGHRRARRLALFSLRWHGFNRISRNSNSANRYLVQLVRPGHKIFLRQLAGAGDQHGRKVRAVICSKSIQSIWGSRTSSRAAKYPGTSEPDTS
jgi:outer membrane protein assembly factor BamB